MKIEQGPFQEIQHLLPQYKEKALAGRFFHCKRVCVLKSEQGYLAVTLTIFERFKAALLHMFGKDYTLNGKKVSFIPNNQLEKLTPVPAQKTARNVQQLGQQVVGVPGNGQQPGQPAGAPAAGNVQQLGQQVVGVPENGQQPGQQVAGAPAAGNGQQPGQHAAGVPGGAPMQQPGQPAGAPAAGNVQQPGQQVAGAPGGAPMQQRGQPAGAPAAGNVQQPPPQQVQNLSAGDLERIVKRGFPLSRTTLAQLENLLPQFEAYMQDRQYQADEFRNMGTDFTRVDTKDINRPRGIDLNIMEMCLRLLVMKGRLAAFVRGRAAFTLFENERQIIWNDASGFYKRENVFTKAKLLEIDQHMSQVRFPQSNFSGPEKIRYNEIEQKLIDFQYQRVKDRTMGEARDLQITQMGSHEVMDFLVKSNVIAAWNYYPNLNNLLVKFAPTDVLNHQGGLGFNSWRDAAMIQRDEEFKRKHRIEIPANADLSKFSQSESKRLNEIVDLLNKRVAHGKYELYKESSDQKLVTWLKDQQLIADFKPLNMTIHIYVKPEDKTN